MNTIEFIPVAHLSKQYSIEETFIIDLHDKGVLHLNIVEETHCLHCDSMPVFEKIMRIHDELHINIEGIDVILNLLDKIDNLNRQLVKTQNRLGLYE